MALFSAACSVPWGPWRTLRGLGHTLKKAVCTSKVRPSHLSPGSLANNKCTEIGLVVGLVIGLVIEIDMGTGICNNMDRPAAPALSA